MLDQLQAAAQDPSTDGRNALLRLLTRCVFADRAPSAAEIAIFCDIVDRLLPQAGEEARAQLAEAIADHADLPDDLVDRLATDSIPVAEPILRRSPVLTDEDLARYVGSTSEAHRVAIAGRYGLSADLVDLLLGLGEMPVFRAVAENGSARVSAQSAHRLVDLAERDDELCRSLSLRSDLPFDDAERIVLLVARRLKNRMGGKTAPAAEAPAAAPAPTGPAPPQGQLALAEILARHGGGALSLDDAVQMLAREDRYNDLAAFLANVSGVDELALLKVLVRADANGIMQVLRGLGVDEATWKQVVELRRRRLKFSDTQRRFEIDDFPRLSIDVARQTLAQFSRKRAAG